MVEEHAKSFISKTHRIQGLIKRSWADEGRPISEYFVPFKSNLRNPQNDPLMGLVGTEADAFHIINRETQLWKDIKEEAAECNKQWQQIRLRQEQLERDLMMNFTPSNSQEEDLDDED